MEEKQPVIAIDGPAGAGKSTIAKLAAEKLGYVYIDTGAMYRAVSYSFLKNGGEFSETLLGEIANTIEISFKPEAGKNRVFVNGEEITEEIRKADVTAMVSKVAAVGAVREAMVDQQRRMGDGGGVIMDGRDIGTVVFPNAEIKIFLTATVEERAMRRYKELVAKGEEVDLAELREQIAERDKQDSEREISPLRQAEDAEYLDTSDMTIEEVVTYIINKVQVR